MKGLDHTTASTLQDGEHERGDFKASANTSDIVGDVLVHVDGCWNRPWLRTVNKGRKLVGSREVAGGRVTAFGQGGRNSRSIAPFHGSLHVMTTRTKMIRTEFAHVSIGLWQSVTKILLGARVEGTPGQIMSGTSIVQALYASVFGISVG